jgi:hypothetical protein
VTGPAERDDDPDRHELAEALIAAAARLRWRASVLESTDWRVTILVLPPLARSRPERNRWPDEPEEGFEAGERDREGVFDPNRREG